MAAVLLPVEACDDSALENTQNTAFESYLNSRGEYTVIDGIYRYIAGNLISDPDIEKPVIENGDRVMLGYEFCTFASSGDFPLVYTNREDMMYKYLSPIEMEWDFEPVKIIVGEQGVIDAMDRALPGCIKGDSVLFFIPSTLAFGKRGEGMIPPDTPVVYKVIIDDIIKKDN
jgi:hypothetical protein